MGAVLGAVAGGQKDKTSSQTNSSQESYLRVGEATAEEKRARELQLSSLNDLDARLKELESSPVMASLNNLLMELGQAPSQARINEANAYTNSQFAAQEEALNQSFEDQTTAYAQRAAQMGRSSADPILAAKLAQEQIRQRSTLNAQKTGFASEYAQNAASRNFSNQLTGLSGLAQSAIQNRQAVYSLGSDFANTLSQYRLATATQVGSGQSATNQYSGGGFKGAVAGFNAGSKADASIAMMALSDKEEKTDIEDLIGKVKAMFKEAKPYGYRYKEGTERRISPMAQELEGTELGAQLVSTDAKGRKFVDYGKAMGFMFAAIADLSDSVAKLEANVLPEAAL